MTPVRTMVVAALTLLPVIAIATPAEATYVSGNGSYYDHAIYATADEPPGGVIFFDQIDHEEVYTLVLDGAHYDFISVSPADGSTHRYTFPLTWGAHEWDVYDSAGNDVTTDCCFQSTYHVDLDVRPAYRTFEPLPVDGDRDLNRIKVCYGLYPAGAHTRRVRFNIVGRGGVYRHYTSLDIANGECVFRRWDGTDDFGWYDGDEAPFRATATVRFGPFRQEEVTQITSRSTRIYWE